MKIIRDDFYVRLLCDFNLRCVLSLVTIEIKVVKMDALDMEVANVYSRKTQSPMHAPIYEWLYPVTKSIRSAAFSMEHLGFLAVQPQK